MKKTIGLVLILVLGTMVFSGCNKQGGKQDGEIMVGYAVRGMIDEYWANQIKGMEAANAANGSKFKLEVADSNYTPQTCLENALSFLSRGAKVLVVSAPDPQVGGAIMERANALGIPVVTSDVFFDGTYFLTHDEVRAGEIAGEIAGQYYLNNFSGQPAKVALLGAFQVADSSNMRLGGFRAAFSKLVPGAVYLPEFDGEGLREKSANLMADIITANPDVNFVFAVNDESALGAAASIEARGLSGKIVSIGLGGIGEAPFQALLDPNSPFKGTVAFGPYEHGESAVTDLILPLLEGKTPPQIINSPLEAVTGVNAKKFLDAMK
jgi:ribose transport system substrate-binding protein